MAFRILQTVMVLAVASLATVPAGAVLRTTVPADLAVEKSDSPDPVSPGAELTYAIVVTNLGDTVGQQPAAADDVLLSDTLPAGTTFVSLLAPAGWTATTPAVGATGTVTASLPTLASGASAEFVLVVAVDGGATPGSVIMNTAAVSAATSDPDISNNTSTAATLVAAAVPVSGPLALVVLLAALYLLAARSLTRRPQGA
jgi:uncharacterized repeat protein (TIGR01451 family)